MICLNYLQVVEPKSQEASMAKIQKESNEKSIVELLKTQIKQRNKSGESSNQELRKQDDASL